MSTVLGQRLSPGQNCQPPKIGQKIPGRQGAGPIFLKKSPEKKWAFFGIFLLTNPS
jgi:hypothetical protein